MDCPVFVLDVGRCVLEHNAAMNGRYAGKCRTVTSRSSRRLSHVGWYCTAQDSTLSFLLRVLQDLYLEYSTAPVHGAVPAQERPFISPASVGEA